MLKAAPRWQLVSHLFGRLFWPQSWSEWRTLVSGICLASFCAGIVLWYSHGEWTAERELADSVKALEMRELWDDLRTTSDELHVTQSHNDLLNTRWLLAIATRTLQDQGPQKAQARLGEAAAFLNAVNATFAGVSVRRLDQLKERLATADLRGAQDHLQAREKLTGFIEELDTLLGEGTPPIAGPEYASP